MLPYYNPTAERLDYLHIPKSTLIPGMNTTTKIVHIPSSVLRLPYVRTIFDDTTMDHIGQMQAHLHLQGEYGPMYYWLTRFPWGIDTKADRDHGPTTAFDLLRLNEDDVLVIINMR
eukprot:9215521-Pyramimonas_sp.AAC.1